MATHAAKEDGVPGLFRPARQRPPRPAQGRGRGLLVLEVLGAAVSIIVMAVVLIKLREITWGVVLLFVFLPTEGLLVAWQAMRAPWDRLSDKDDDTGGG